MIASLLASKTNQIGRGFRISIQKESAEGEIRTPEVKHHRLSDPDMLSHTRIRGRRPTGLDYLGYWLVSIMLWLIWLVFGGWPI